MSSITNIFLTGMIVGLLWSQIDTVAKYLGLAFGGLYGVAIGIGMYYKRWMKDLFDYQLKCHHADLSGIFTLILSLSFLGNLICGYLF